MKSTSLFIIIASIFMVLIPLSAAEPQCEVVQSIDVETSDEQPLEIGDTIHQDQEVTTGSNGELTLLCGGEITQIGPDQQGEISEIGEAQSLDSEADFEEEMSFEDVVENADEIEENLDEVNREIDENVPDSLKSVILGDRVNFEVDDAVLGIESDDTGITGLEEDGVDDPTLEIRTSEDVMEEIMESEDPMEELRQAYEEEDGIEVEAHTWRNKILFGTVNFASSAYDFIDGFTG